MAFLTIFLLCIVIGYPIWDYYYMKKGDFGNKIKMYLTIIIPQWVTVAIILIFWLMTNRSLNDMFHVKEPILNFQMDNLKGIGMGVLTAAGFYVLLFIFSKKLKQKFSKFIDNQIDGIRFMMPSKLKERILFVLVALTAGFCEEVVFRGVMLTYFESLPFHLSVVAIAIIMSLLFGMIHLYQGWKGVLGTAYLGGILLYVYLITGNLWISILIHFLIDVKFVFFPNKNRHLTNQITKVQI